MFRLHNEVEKGHDSGMPGLKTIRRAITWAAVGLSGAVLFGLVAEWFIHVAEDKGWYRHAGQTWDQLVSGLVQALTSPEMTYAAIAFGGVALGMWIASFLYRKERKPLENEARQHFIDRVELAKEAEELARQIAALAAQGHARNVIASQEDRDDFRSGLRPVPVPSRGRATRERASAVEKYGEKYHADAWRIINAAGRLVRFDRSDIWKVQHIMMSGYSIEEMAEFLMAISNDLRFPNEPLLAQTDRILKDQAEAAARQLPQGTGSETQP